MSATSKHTAARTAAVSGHIRRAQTRLGRVQQQLTRALDGDAPRDIFIQASAAAVAAAMALRLLRTTFPGSLIVRWAPMALFALFYQRSMLAARR